MCIENSQPNFGPGSVFLSHVPHPTVHMAMWEGWETVKPRKEQQKNWEST
jgi:hypothetical protein